MKMPDREPIISYVHKMRSRYSETDRMGYVYYARYLEYFEVARTEMIRRVGLTYREMEEDGIMLPVVHVNLDYHAPILYDELMHIHVYSYDVPNVKLETFYEVKTEASDKVHISGMVTLCFMDAETRRPCKAPQSFLEGLKRA